MSRWLWTWRIVIIVALWVAGAASSFILDNRLVGYFFFAALVTFCLGTIAFDVIRFRRERKRWEPTTHAARVEETDHRMRNTLVPIREPHTCEKCGEAHGVPTEAYRWHYRRSLWLAGRDKHEMIYGRPAGYWFREEARFMSDLALVLSAQDRAFIEHMERSNGLFVGSSWLWKP